MLKDLFHVMNETSKAVASSGTILASRDQKKRTRKVHTSSNSSSHEECVTTKFTFSFMYSTRDLSRSHTVLNLLAKKITLAPLQNKLEISNCLEFTLKWFDLVCCEGDFDASLPN